MKKRRERTDEEKHKLAEKLYGKNYDDPGPLWGFKTISTNLDALDAEEFDDSSENIEKKED